MENLQSYSLTDSDFIPQRDTETTEWFEDASSNADWIDNFSDPISAASLGDESYNPLESYENLCQKNKNLEQRWQDVEQKYESLLRERERQSLHLLHEQEKVQKYQQKLQYIKSNCDVVNQLKEKYLSAKSMLSNTKDNTVSVEKSCQTISGLELQNAINYEKDVIVVVKRSELQVMKETLGKLKGLVDNYRVSASNAEKSKYETEIRQLHNTIANLKDTVSKKSYYLDIAKQNMVDRKTFESVQKESESLKRIVVKMEKRLREMCSPMHSFPVLNDEENAFVEQIIRAYHQEKPKLNPKLHKAGNSTLHRRSSSSSDDSKDIGAFGAASNAKFIPVINLPNHSSGDV
ncbi:hypothetical protein PPYR_08774 [Photinus pyralis]|uniref:Uncharacterized protein n=1 Tax=Photinus pyralis TaxID=7054 RepID=A0A1Y1MRH9_PHOPY|nr:golgin IMH1-like isoform X2 [Photinus pyralis]KAB0797781.1 hypothetical protein PPYR_08774 [Photinus pyralis]